MLFHHSRAFIEKHKKHHHFIMAMFALVVAGASVYVYRNELVQAATFTWVQDDWSGGVTTATSTHPAGQTLWTEYSATTNASTSASGVSILPASYTFTDDLATSSTSLITSGGGFGNGTTYASTTVSGDSVGMISGGGGLTLMGTTTTNYTATTPYGFIISPDNRFLYVGGSTNLNTYTRNLADGTLTHSASSPQNSLAYFAIATTSSSATLNSLYVSHPSAFGGDLSQYSVNVETGAVSALVPPNPETNLVDPATSNGSIIVISPDSKSVYLSGISTTNSRIYQYSRNTATGVLSALAPQPHSYVDLKVGTNPAGLAISSDGLSVYSSNFGSVTSEVLQFTRNTTDGDQNFGRLTANGVSTIAVPNVWSYDLVVSNDGASVYTASLANNPSVAFHGILIFSRDQNTGIISNKNGTVTIDSTSDLLTTGAPHLFNEGDTILFSSGTTPPGGLTAGITYYVLGGVSLTSHTFKVSTLMNGSPVNFTSNGANPLYYVGGIGFDIGATVVSSKLAVSDDDTSVYLAAKAATGNQGYVMQYSRNKDTGHLTPLGQPSVSSGAGEQGTYYVDVSSDGRFVYSVNRLTNTISTFSRAPTVMSGTFTSAIIDLGAKVSSSLLSWVVTTPTYTGITMEVQTSVDGNTWSGYSPIANGGSIGPDIRYVRYRASFTRSDSLLAPTLDSVTINYEQYASADLTSSKYDSGSTGNLVNRITWTASTSTTETVKFQVRSSADGNTWSGWCGGASDTMCDGSTYFVDADNGVAFATNNPLRSGGNDQFFQYKVFLTSGGGATPLLSSVSVQYVVNAPPDFDATYGTNGIVVAQVTDSGSADFGKVTISYKIRDIDTTTGTANANFVTPSFQYNVGGGWVSITSDKLAVGDTSNKGVQEVYYSTYTATWTASSTVTASTASAQVRVTINDNEAANSSAVATSANFTLDTTAPVAYSTLDSSSGGSAVGNVVLSATDISTLQYRICNSNTFSSPDAQGNSCAWSTLGGNLASSSVAWIPTGAPNEETVYLQVRDLYGNVTAQTIIAPKTPPNFVYKDVADPLKDQYWEFLSWGIFQATTSSAFASYKIYHASSTSETPAPSAGDYNLVTTITDPGVNFYRHIITSATSSYHFYKVQSIDTDGDVSDFTSVASDIPNGQGGIDTTAPLISNIATASVRSNSATITWNTDEISNSEVSYGTTQSYGSSVVVSSYTTAHSVTITGLAQNTTYYFRVRSADPATTPNVSNWTVGGTFTTTGGPTIVESTDGTPPVVVPTNTSAEITWHTNVSSDSYVTYSTNRALSGGTRVGVATYTTTQDATGYVHTVTIPGLIAGTPYYFQVESTDANGTTYNKPTGTSVSHYSFNTNIDTQPPVISATSTPVLASDSTVIVWQTDELATSQVFYDTVPRGNGITNCVNQTSAHAYRTARQSTMSIFHVATLSSATEKYDTAGGSLILGGNVLTPETTYYTVVCSVDPAGNGASSNEWSFTTPSSGTVTIIQMGGSSKKGEIIPDTSAPIISGFKVSDITPFGAVVAFSTDEEAVSFAEFGKDASYGDTSGSLKYAKDHKLKIRGLTLGTEYNIRAGAVDKAGNVGTGSNQTFKTAFLSENLKDLAQIENIEAFQKEIENTIESILPSLVPPFVSKPQVVEITDSSAKITFKTNIKSFPIVMYAEQGRYDDTKDNPYTGEVSNTENKGTEHTLTLTGLKPNTKYHYQTRAFSLPKVIGKSEDLTFITKAAKIAGSIVEKKKDSFTVVWTTTEPTTSIVEYKNLKTGVTERKTDSAMKTSHSMKVENLPSGTTYAVDISGLTEAGNTMEAGSPLSVTTSTDVTSPIISGFKVDNAFIPGRADRVQTIISWTTDESANSVVYYEEGTGTAGDTKELARKSENLDSYITKHSIILPSLKPGTIYRIKVTSSDDSGNLGSFGPRTVITPRQTESITDIIFKNFEDSFKFLRQI